VMGIPNLAAITSKHHTLLETLGGWQEPLA